MRNKIWSLTLSAVLVLLTSCGDPSNSSTSSSIDYTAPYVADYSNSEKLKIDFEYTSADIYTLASCVDGDTAYFNELDERVRYLGINTPETAYLGQQVFAFLAKRTMCDWLTNAKSIVIEVQSTDTYGRHLGYVWVNLVDSKKENYFLTNLRIIEESLSFNNEYGTKYSQIFFDAYALALKKGRRVYSYGKEADPDCENRECRGYGY